VEITWIGDEYLVFLGAFVSFLHLLPFVCLPLEVAFLVLLNLLHAEEAKLFLLDLIFNLIDLFLQPETLLHS
jgi:hypothetical protein